MVDWENEQSQQAFLMQIVQNSQRLQRPAQGTWADLVKNYPQHEQIDKARQLLE